MEVAAVLARPLEEERRDPVVVLAGRLAVDDRPGHDDVRVAVAHAPERREHDVHVELQRAAPVIEEAVEPLGVLGRRDAVEALRRIAKPAGALDEERREQPQARVADPALVVRKPARAGGALPPTAAGRPSPSRSAGAPRGRRRVDPPAARSRARFGGAARGPRRRPTTAWARSVTAAAEPALPRCRPCPARLRPCTVARIAAIAAHWTSRNRTLTPTPWLAASRREPAARRSATRAATARTTLCACGTRSCVCASRSFTCTTSSASSDLAQDERHPRAERVGAAELALERAAARVDVAANPAPPQLAREDERHGRSPRRRAARRSRRPCSTAPRRSLAMRSRSRPAAKPIAGTWGPPRSATMRS